MVETNQLLKTIQDTKSDGLNTLMESLDDLTFSEYLNHIIDAKHISKAQVLSKTTIQRNYGYQIFDGSKVPNKDKVIQLSLGLGLDLRMTNNLLSLSNNASAKLSLPPTSSNASYFSTPYLLNIDSK